MIDLKQGKKRFNLKMLAEIFELEDGIQEEDDGGGIGIFAGFDLKDFVPRYFRFFVPFKLVDFLILQYFFPFFAYHQFSWLD